MTDIEQAFNEICDRLGCAYDNEAALFAIDKLQKSAPSDAEPVAWRYNLSIHSKMWSFTDERHVAANRQESGWRVEPLYTAPPRPDTQSDATLIELEEKVHFWQGEAEKWMKTVQSIDRTPPTDAAAGPVGWTCFHCGEHFDNIECANIHFGMDEHRDPGCVEKLKGGDLGLLRRVRELEEQLIPYLQETSAVENYVQGLQADHNRAVVRAEEEGYNKGLRDAPAGLIEAAEWHETQRQKNHDSSKDHGASSSR